MTFVDFIKSPAFVLAIIFVLAVIYTIYANTTENDTHYSVERTEIFEDTETIDNKLFYY